jgi:hypothetical protein
MVQFRGVRQHAHITLAHEMMVMAIDIIRLKERLELNKVVETMVARIEELKADFQWHERNRHGTSK